MEEGKIKCPECGDTWKPFYFGDKPLNREVVDICKNCNTDIVFKPIDLYQSNQKE